MACALVLAVPLLALAQAPEPAPQQPAPETKPAEVPQQPAAGQQPEAQQPSPGAQVHTGTSSGVDAEARLRALLADHQFLQLESQLDSMSPADAQLYRGLLANRSNDAKTSLQLLEPLADEAAAAGDKPREKLIRKAVAEDYLRLGDWAKAAKAYQTLDSRLNTDLTADERDEIEMPLKLLPLAAANPPTTVEPCDPFKLQVYKNPLGLTDVGVWVDARPHTWMLDPTAPFNLISRSIAHEVGLRVSDEAATIHSLTGRPIQVHMAIVPRFTIGGRLTLRNMTVFVFEDADYFFPRSQYQVQGVLGYPALQAIGSLTVTGNSTIELRPAAQVAPPENDDKLTTGARFFLDGDRVLVALGKPGQERTFAVDAGGQQTYLTSRYYDEHAPEFAGQKLELFTIPGAQSLVPQPAFVAETIPIEVGPVTVHVHYVRVLIQPLSQTAVDDVYGVLGVDALDQLSSYTFDYRTMRFAVRPE
ncbi:MAG: aspartyl protease family protein [Terracidiphilus sp.]